MSHRVVVFSDLDGSLLDHDDYSWSAASAAVSRLRQKRIPLVLASSKTKAEMLEIRRQLGNEAPFVSENGAAIYVPRGALPVSPDEDRAEVEASQSKILLGRDRAEILKVLREIRRRRGFRFEGFADWTVDDVRARTGLDAIGAAAAMSRDATEPLVWLDDAHQPEELAIELEPHGLRLVRGGRFFHVMGSADKGTATCWLAERYRRQLGQLLTVAVGDSPNDLEMLRSADVAIVIPRAEGAPIDPRGARRVIRADHPGAAGWQQGMDRFFESLETVD